MIRNLTFGSFLFLMMLRLALPGGASAEAKEPMPKETPSIAWSDLLPVTRADDPYSLLTTTQLQDLAHVARVRNLIAADKLPADGDDAKEIATITARLGKEGVDVDLLLSMRDQIRRLRDIQNKATRSSLHGKTIQLAGFVASLGQRNGQVTKFFLVPTYDACTHAIPPPANQTVLVEWASGIELPDDRTPVLVTGRIVAQQTKATVPRSSGQTRVAAAYVIEPTAVEIHKLDGSVSKSR